MSKVTERDLWEMNFIESFGFPIELTNKWIEYRNQKIKERDDDDWGFPSIDSRRKGEYQYYDRLWKERILYGTKGEMRENGKELIKEHLELLEERDRLYDYLSLIKEMVKVNNESLRTQKNQ
jgi:hypothetical protein